MFTPQVNACLPYLLYASLIIGFICLIAFIRGVGIVNTRHSSNIDPDSTPSPSEHGELPSKGQR